LSSYEIPYDSVITIDSLKNNKAGTVLNEILRKINEYCSKEDTIDISKLITEDIEDKIEKSIKEAVGKKLK
jgi:hypothetical protein